MLLKSAMSRAAFMVLVLSLPASTLAADGDLDPTFGTAGLVTTDFATSFDEARGLAIQADGHEVETVEGLAEADGGLSPLQDAFWEAHALQCGYCTPGMLMASHALLRSNPDPTEDEIKEAIGGNLCRCTGYQQIVEAVRLAAKRMRGADPEAGKDTVDE